MQGIRSYRKSGGRRRMAAWLVVVFLLAAGPAEAVDRYFTGLGTMTPVGDLNTYLWDDPDNWGPPGQPDNGDRVFMTQSDAVNRQVRYFPNWLVVPLPKFEQWTIDALGSGNIGLWQLSWNLKADEVCVGFTGRGSFSQWAGYNTFHKLAVGVDPESSGEYYLYNNANLDTYRTQIGL
jgi:hypothetical protein